MPETLGRLHHLGAGVKAVLAGVLGIGYLVAWFGLFETAFLGFWTFLGSSGQDYGPAFVGLVMFYLSCAGLGILNTGFARAAVVGLLGAVSAGVTLLVLAGFMIPLVTSLETSGCPACEFLRDSLSDWWIWMPGFVPAIVILALSVPMSQARWRGMGVGLLVSLLVGFILPGIGAPLGWAVITYGTLRAKAPVEGGQQEV